MDVLQSTFEDIAMEIIVDLMGYRQVSNIRRT